MHEAYEAVPILEKLPLQIESIACFEEILLVGTKQGHLLQYKIKKVSSKKSGGETKVDLERSNKSFAKKPITQLVAVPEFFILISLSDNVISVHDLQTFNLITCVNKTKGATLFATDVQRMETMTGEAQYTLRIGVASKKKVQLFYWKNRDFHELLNDLGMYDQPRAMAWCRDSLCVGFRREYFMINVQTGDLKELFPLGNRQTEPIVTKLDRDRLALGRDEMSILVNAQGDPVSKHPFHWSDIPYCMEFDPPYVVALLPKFVEVRAFEPKLNIQTIDLPKARFMCYGSGCLYVASSAFVWRLQPVAIQVQIGELVKDKQFELALKLANMNDEPDQEREARKRNINNLYAFHLFCQRNFEDSMKLFLSLDTDPSHVIGLFPNLLPQEYRSQLEYPEPVPDLEGQTLEKGLLALQDYLTMKRRALVKDDGRELRIHPIVEGNNLIKSKKQLSQIIDTTLLKCYLQTNDALVAPLLRLKDNNCHVDECERILKKKEKFHELIILYEKKKLHQKALNLLMKQAARPDSPLKGHDRTVTYLQHLGKGHLPLIFEYAEWVLKKYPEDGLKIFTEDLPEVEALPREEVLKYLEKINSALAISYLEHIILHCKDTTPEFHNRLGMSYQERTHALMEEYVKSLPEGHRPQKAGQEPGELGDLRKRLIVFLKTSKHYVPERLLTRFPLDSFYEERAILLGRLGRHEQALGLYVHVLEDPVAAEEHCAAYFDEKREGNKDVYLSLLRVYLHPPDPSSLGCTTNSPAPPRPPDLRSCLKLLEGYAPRFDSIKVLELLPADTPLVDILTFLEHKLVESETRRRVNQVLKSMLFSENLQTAEHLLHLQREKVVINEETMCSKCGKRLGDSAFKYRRGGSPLHYYCADDQDTRSLDSGSFR